MTYAELDLVSAYSFLEGASHAEELVLQAKALGLSAIGIADRNTLAGVVKGYAAMEKHGLRVLVGARLVFTDATTLIVYPRDRAAYGRLCRLLSLGKSEVLGDGPKTLGALDRPDRVAKADCHLSFEQALDFAQGLIGIVPAPVDLDAAFEARLADWARRWPDTVHLAVAPLHRGDDRARLNRLAGLAARARTPMLATNAPLYHHYNRRRLQDVMTCIREKTTIDEAGLRLQANAERFLKSPQEMARLFRGHEAALERTAEVLAACTFRLDELRYHYPDEPVPPGRTADQHLRRLVKLGAWAKFGGRGNVPTKIARTIRKELKLIRELGYPHYFLTVHDVVAWARGQKILCQGRGSAANSVVCFCLDITAVNPAEQELLFERFLSKERQEPPDIDVDFEHERREEVIQYVYGRYGRHRAAICATVIHYRPRSAIREVGKALGLTEDVTAALANTVWGSWGDGVDDNHVDRTGLDRSSPRLQLALELTAALIHFPRHLSQHVGGFVLTQDDLVDMVPVGNAAMAERTFIEWDKDDIDALGLMKVDVLALGMLTAIRKGFDLIAAHYGRSVELADLTPDDASVYAMLKTADSLGVFQVESRAQMAMLPRLQPTCFYDLAVQVAIVRPGPIQGGMVHPYLKRRVERRETERRGGRFKVDYPSPGPPHDPRELEAVLDRTLGVPIFQEQAMRIAMVAAEFSGDEANGLRRAMATFRHMGTIHQYEEMMVGRMIARGYDPEFAAACFNQIKGFGEYGFPESHAIAFAHLVYVSAWIKCHHPDVFAACLLNSQPMGFYAPAQIVRDAREHRVEVRHPDVNASDWDCTLEPAIRPARTAWGRPIARALRLGLRQIDGFRTDWGEAIMRARSDGPFVSIGDLRTRAALPARALELLAAADALTGLELDRRGGLWAARGLPKASPAPLFAAAGLDENDGAPPATLPRAAPSEEVVRDYETIRLSLKGHPVGFLRERLAGMGAITAKAMEGLRDGARCLVGGVVLVRQRPGSARGVMFMTVEDETGIVNAVLWPKIFEQFRPVAMTARLVLIRGRIQRADGVVHLITDTLEDRTADLAMLSDGDLKPQMGRGDGPRSGSPDRGEVPNTRVHPRNVRVLPASRDFH